jgi:MFS family permease
MSTGDISGGRLLCAVKEAEMPDPPSGWSSTQRKVVLACYLGWTLDAFDFFLLVFVLKDIAAEFHTEIGDVTIAILLTLAMRPLGAFLFGRAADRYGRRPTLMVNVVLYSLLEFASGFAPSLTVLIVLRALYGIAMGVEWGGRRFARHGDNSVPVARLCVGASASGLSERLPHRVGCLCNSVSAHRLARHVHDRGAPWFSIFAAPFRNHQAGSAPRRPKVGRSPCCVRIGSSASMRCC